MALNSKLIGVYRLQPADSTPNSGNTSPDKPTSLVVAQYARKVGEGPQNQPSGLIHSN